MKITMLLFAAFAAAACSADTENSYVSIYYIPFGVETYVPVTTDNIEKSAQRYGRIDSGGRLSKKISDLLMAAGEGSFNSERVRAKLIYPNEVIVYVDNLGGVLTSEMGARKIDERRLHRLGNLLEKATQPIGGQ